ncbi:MAG: sialidase family protein, partial [Candidatus Kapaibacterium sp.]
MKSINYIIFAIFAAFLAGSATGSFAQWTADTKISVSDTNAALSENADICLAVSGDSLHAVWWDTKTDSTAIFYRHSYDGGITWAAPMRLTPLSKSVDFPSIAVSGSMVHVSYRNNDDSGSYYIRSTDGGKTWGNPVSLGTYYFWPSVAASGSNVYIGFNPVMPGNSEVYFRRSTDNGSTWSATTQISNALNRSEDQSISASGSYVHFVWNDNRTGIMQ